MTCDDSENIKADRVNTVVFNLNQTSDVFLGNPDCFISNFKLTCEDSENIKADRVNTVVFNLNQTSDVFFGKPSITASVIFSITFMIMTKDVVEISKK